MDWSEDIADPDRMSQRDCRGDLLRANRCRLIAVIGHFIARRICRMPVFCPLDFHFFSGKYDYFRKGDSSPEARKKYVATTRWLSKWLE